MDCLSTMSVSFSSEESATRLLSTPVDSITRRLVSTYTFIRHERKPQAMRAAGTRKMSSSHHTQLASGSHHTLSRMTRASTTAANRIHLIISATKNTQWWRSV